MLKQQARLMGNLQRTGDILLTAAAFAAAYVIKKDLLPGELGGLAEAPNYYFILLLSLVVFSLSYNFFRLYDSFRNQTVEGILLKVAKSAFVGIAVVALLLYLLKVQDISRILMALFVLLDILLLSAAKVAVWLVLRYIRGKGFNYRAVLIIGGEGRAEEIAGTIDEVHGSGYRVVGRLAPGEEERGPGKSLAASVRMLGTMRDFREVLLGKAIDEVIFASPLTEVEDAGDYISFAEELGVSVHILLDWQLHNLMYRPETATVYYDKFLGLPSIVLSSTPQRGGELLVKSFLDYAGASLSVLLFSPLLAVIAAAIKLTSKGPVLYTQVRCGENGRKFTMYKFRTMIENADQVREPLYDQNEMDGPVFKMKDDPRVTGLGRILRKTSLDELPQLFNVLRGEMSLVGPRPPIPEEVEKYQPWQRRRLSMKPGMTCLWQVDGRNKATFEEWMRMDLEYIDSWSLYKDFKIILRTIPAVLWGTGK